MGLTLGNHLVLPPSYVFFSLLPVFHSEAALPHGPSTMIQLTQKHGAKSLKTKLSKNYYYQMYFFHLAVSARKFQHSYSKAINTNSTLQAHISNYLIIYHAVYQSLSELSMAVENILLEKDNSGLQDSKTK